MRDDFLPFCRPYISEEEIAAVGEVLRSGWITTGPKTAEFERRFRESVGSPAAVALSRRPPACTWLSKPTASGPGTRFDPVVDLGLHRQPDRARRRDPGLRRRRPGHLMAAPEDFEAKISDRTRAIIPVHFAGAAADMDPIRELAADSGYRGRRGRGPRRRHPVPGRAGRRRRYDRLLVPPDQEHHHRRGRHGLLRRRGADRASAPAEIPRPRRRTPTTAKTQGRAPQAEVLEPGYKYNLTDIAAAHRRSVSSTDCRRASTAASRARRALSRRCSPMSTRSCRSRVPG